MKKIIALLWGIFSLVAVGAQPFATNCIIIEEIFPDPSPSVGLPEFEFIELLNRSDSTIDLRNWSVGDPTSRTQIPFSVLLAPDSVLILCSQSAAQVYSRLGKTVGLPGFPSLNNQSDQLVLYAPNGRVIHALEYEQSWYHNAAKSLGGWSLEMINPHHACAGMDNWEASNDASGGTPGRLNSPHASFQDQAGPRLVRAYFQDSVTLLLEFDEPLDSVAAITRARYPCYPQLELQNILPLAPFFKVLVITLSKAADPEKIYQLRISGLVDCSGNLFDENELIRIAISVPLQPGSLVINEVLFNPPPDGYDYVELYNRGRRPVNLEQLRLANRSLSSGNNIVSPIEKPTLLFPGDYAVLTENKSWLLRKYRLTPAAAVFEAKKLPALPDDKGGIAILNYDGRVVDELEYSHLWHHPLLANEEGVALERIDPSGTTQDIQNWTSAASSSGWGTPGIRNSQFIGDFSSDLELAIDPTVFSPDNDGWRDRIGIYYKTDRPGFQLTVRCYDALGYVVALPVEQATLAQKGVFWWNGLSSRQAPLPYGIYILAIEMVHPGGKVSQWKKAVTLVHR